MQNFLRGEMEARKPPDVIVVHAGATYNYTIPSFSAIQMDLKHVVLNGVDDDPRESFDAFIRVGRQLIFDKQPPILLSILSACVVPVSRPLILLEVSCYS